MSWFISSLWWWLHGYMLMSKLTKWYTLHITYIINYTSINLFLKCNKSLVYVKFSQRWLERAHNAQLLCLQSGTDPVAPQCSWSVPLSPSGAGESICSKHHFASCEVIYSFYSSHLRSVVGRRTPYLPPSFQGNPLCQHQTDWGKSHPQPWEVTNA